VKLDLDELEEMFSKKVTKKELNAGMLREKWRRMMTL
jgi:hypothetical protein